MYHTWSRTCQIDSLGGVEDNIMIEMGKERVIEKTVLLLNMLMVIRNGLLMGSN